MSRKDTRTGAYRLWRQAGGRGAFAEVRVEVTRTGDGRSPDVAWAVSPADTRSVQPGSHAAEADAALVGAADALGALTGMGVDTAGWHVSVTQVGIMHADTEPTAVRAAAAAATVAAFDAKDAFEIVYDGGWRLRPSGGGPDTA